MYFKQVAGAILIVGCIPVAVFIPGEWRAVSLSLIGLGIFFLIFGKFLDTMPGTEI